MADAGDFSKDVEALRDELAALRADWARVAGKAEALGRRQGGDAKDQISAGLDALRARIAKEAGDAGEAIGKEVDELGVLIDAYATEARKAVAARPLYTLLGAVAIGFVLGRITR